MNRDPTLHIKYSDLKELFKLLELDENKLTQLFILGKEKSPVNRKLIALNTKKQVQEYAKTLQSSKIAAEFYLSYADFHKENQGKSINITPNSQQWQYVENAAKYYLEFCEITGKKVEENFGYFIELSYICNNKKLSLKRIPYLFEKIVEEHEIRELIVNDVNKEITKQLYTQYLRKLHEVGIDYELFKTNKVYKEFVKASIDIKNLKASVNSWLDAQFAGLAFLDAFPQPEQMHGVNAQKRYRNYLLKMNK